MPLSIAISTSFAYRIKDTATTCPNNMAISNGILGPILGGLLGFLGAIGAAIVAFILARRNRVRQTDEERIGTSTFTSLIVQVC